MKLKLLVCSAVSVLVASLLFGILPIRGEESVYQNTVRLHVKAASDSEEDQRLKLLVRDEVLSILESRLAGVTDRDEACRIISASAEEIRLASECVLSKAGGDDSVEVTLTDEDYPERVYDDFSLPAGQYRSLRVTLGEGGGHNWWCILFPSVCAADAVSAEEDYIDAGFTSEQYRMIERGSGRRYKVRFRILEVLSELFGNRS